MSSPRSEFAICLTDDTPPIGEAVLNELDADNLVANFRILLDTQEAGKGYGTEATKLVLEYGFRTLGLNRIELGIFTFNPRAVRAYEKAGFIREGVQREVLKDSDIFHDSVMMSILRRDFDKQEGLNVSASRLVPASADAER